MSEIVLDPHFLFFDGSGNAEVLFPPKKVLSSPKSGGSKVPDASRNTEFSHYLGFGIPPQPSIQPHQTHLKLGILFRL